MITPAWRTPQGPLRVGVSECLLGVKVRFDGQDKKDVFIVEGLGPYVQWVPVCPEVEVGMGVPRESVRLVRDPLRPENLRMVGNKSRDDWTVRMQGYATARARRFDDDDLVGYIFKRSSPSCGLHRVKVYPSRSDGQSPAPAPDHDGRGLFATAVTQRFPNLPVEEEGRLCDPGLRESFIERIFAYQRLRILFSGRWSAGGLVAFHSAHKLTVLAHEPEAYRRLGRLVAQAGVLPRSDLRCAYEQQFMAALTRVATRGRHTNVLQHMAGYLKDKLDAASRAEMGTTIDDYRRGFVPLVVPLVLLRHHVRVHDISYLADQIYLDPHPKELMLKNHV